MCAGALALLGFKEVRHMLAVVVPGVACLQITNYAFWKSYSAYLFSLMQPFDEVQPLVSITLIMCQLAYLQVVFGCGNDRFGGAGSILDVHERGCGSCGPAGKACADRSGADPQGSQHEAVPAAADTAEQAPAGQQGSCQVGQCPPGASYYNHRGFPCRKGLYADAAVKQLQDFYIAGNPAGEGISGLAMGGAVMLL